MKGKGDYGVINFLNINIKDTYMKNNNHFHVYNNFVIHDNIRVEDTITIF